MYKKTRYIKFADSVVEQICISNWSSDGIGMTYEDAAAVTSLGFVFKGNTDIVSFEELEFFIGLTFLTDGNNHYDGGAFGHCSNLRKIKLPNTLTRTGRWIFSQCTALQNLVLHDGLTVINHGCFYGCDGITEIDIPYSVTAIEANVFTASGSIIQIISRPVIPPTIGANSFNYLNALQKVYVPYSADHSILDAYKNANRWDSLESKMLELNPDGTIPDLD